MKGTPARQSIFLGTNKWLMSREQNRHKQIYRSSRMPPGCFHVHLPQHRSRTQLELLCQMNTESGLEFKAHESLISIPPFTIAYMYIYICFSSVEQYLDKPRSWLSFCQGRKWCRCSRILYQASFLASLFTSVISKVNTCFNYVFKYFVTPFAIIFSESLLFFFILTMLFKEHSAVYQQ